jgi:hypothetical protein
MVDYAQRIKELEDELRDTPYNKRTQHAVGLLKAKIARLRDKAVQRSSKGGAGYSYAARKSGDASVVLVGFPSVGKSTLLNALTNAQSEVGSYAFTTLDVIPGTLEINHAKIQLLDVPGIVQGASVGKGRGREVLSVVRNSDMVLFLVDVHHPEQCEPLYKEVYDSGIRVNQEMPDVKIIRKSRGGISIGSTLRLTKLNNRTIEGILREFRINNADIVIRTDIDSDQLIDIIEGNRHYVPGITVLTKVDSVNRQVIERAQRLLRPDLAVSAQKMQGIEELKELIYRRLGFMRVYCKETGKKADMEVPLILRKGSTVHDMCRKLHRDFVKRFKSARIWGSSAKFPGQRQGLRHTLRDQDVVEIQIF